MLNQHCALENTRCQGPAEMTCAKPSTRSCAATPWRHAAPAAQLLRSDIHTVRRRLKGPLALTLARTWRPRACGWCSGAGPVPLPAVSGLAVSGLDPDRKRGDWW